MCNLLKGVGLSDLEGPYNPCDSVKWQAVGQEAAMWSWGLGINSYCTSRLWQCKAISNCNAGREQSFCTYKQLLTLGNDESYWGKSKQTKKKTPKNPNNAQTLKQTLNSVVLTQSRAGNPPSLSRHFCATSGQTFVYMALMTRGPDGTGTARKEKSGVAFSIQRSSFSHKPLANILTHKHLYIYIIGDLYLANCNIRLFRDGFYPYWHQQRAHNIFALQRWKRK